MGIWLILNRFSFLIQLYTSWSEVLWPSLIKNFVLLSTSHYCEKFWYLPKCYCPRLWKARSRKSFQRIYRVDIIVFFVFCENLEVSINTKEEKDRVITYILIKVCKIFELFGFNNDYIDIYLQREFKFLKKNSISLLMYLCIYYSQLDLPWLLDILFVMIYLYYHAF